MEVVNFICKMLWTPQEDTCFEQDNSTSSDSGQIIYDYSSQYNKYIISMFHCQIYLETTSLGTSGTCWDKNCLFELGGYKTRMYGNEIRLLFDATVDTTHWQNCDKLGCG